MRTIYWKTPAPEACNFVKKETLTQVLSYEFYEFFKNTVFTEHLRVTAPDNHMKNHTVLKLYYHQ